MAKQPTLIETERKRRAALSVKPEEARAISPRVKELVIAMLENGSTITELFRTKGMPSSRSYWRECDNDPAFELECKKAQTRGAAIKIALGMENAEREAEHRDPDRSRVAQSLCAVITTYAEKIAPKEFGQLVKLGGDPNAPLAVQVINYATTLDGGAITQVDSANNGTDARAEIASPLWDDTETAESSEDESKPAIRDARPRTSRRSVARNNGKKAHPKARRKASQVAHRPEHVRKRPKTLG